MAALWAELLGIERVGRDDGFFDLGGHSLLAVQLQSRLSEALGVELPLATLFDPLSLAGLAEIIGEIRTRTGFQALPAITRVSREQPLALSFAQQRLWFLAQLGVGATYHMPMGLRLVGALDSDAWRRSLDRIMARHEALRSVFVSVDGEPRIELLPETCGFPLVEDDLENQASAAERVEELSRLEARAPFDLARGPLIRGRLIRLGPEEHVFLFTQHHIVSDAWSMGVFTRELVALYSAFAAGHGDPLPPLDIQYPDYAAWQREWLSGDRLETQVEYWRRNLADAPPVLELPTDRPRPVEQSFEADFVPVHIDAELTRGLQRVSQEHGTTLFMTVLGAWAALLGRLSGQDDLVIATPAANRSRREVEDLIGFFINTLALRIDLSGEPSLAELLARVRATTLAAQDHQDLPFEQIVEIVAPPRRFGLNPVFQVLFAWQNHDEAEARLELPGLRVEPAGGVTDSAKIDLSLSLGEVDGSIVGGLLYATALFDAATIERHRGYLVALLGALVADAGQPAAMVDLIDPDERALVLGAWNQTDALSPRASCIHQLFEEQARRTPDAVAAVHDGVELSYAELNRQANRLAHRLISLGVGPDVRVALCTERHPRMVVGLLAILKAGGAFVPLDPSYPRQRLEQLMRDAAPALILCDARGCEALGPLDESLPVLALDDRSGLDPVEGDSDPEVPGLTSAHLAYVIYTSGSTGRPKGVLVEHRGVVNLAQAQIDLFAVSARSRVVQFASPSFDASVSEIFMALGAGAALHLPTAEQRADRDALLDHLATNAITHATLPPAFLEPLPDLGALIALQALILAGEAPRLRLVKSLSSATWAVQRLRPHRGDCLCHRVAIPPGLRRRHGADRAPHRPHAHLPR